MKLINMIQKQLKPIILKSLLVTGLFIIVYQFYNLEIIRSNIEDRAFDLVDSIYMHNTVDNAKNAATTILFRVDKFSLKEDNLLNDNNITNYGYLYPRDAIAKFIKTIDNIEVEKQPRALFVDYDFSYKSSPYNKIAYTDNILIQQLKQSRKYVILLPKTSEFNFIENSKDKNIQQLILSKKIIFVSVAYTISKDGYSRRYLPYQYFKEKKYWNAPITLWRLSHPVNDKKLEEFKQKDIIDNRIIYKEYQETSIDIKQNGYSTYSAQSYWEKLTSYSSNYPLFELDLNNSLILFGAIHNESNDLFTVNALSNETISGVEMHANALMTIFKNNGALKHLPIFYSIIILFILYTVIDILIEWLFAKLRIDSIETLFMISLLISSVLLFLTSILILELYGLWFNWFIPFILFEIYEIIEILIIYYKRTKKKKQQGGLT